MNGFCFQEFCAPSQREKILKRYFPIMNSESEIISFWDLFCGRKICDCPTQFILEDSPQTLR